MNENFVRKYLQVPIKRGEIRIEGKQVIHGPLRCRVHPDGGCGVDRGPSSQQGYRPFGHNGKCGSDSFRLCGSLVLLQLPVGNLGDRFGHKRFLVAGYVIAGLTGFLYFKAGSVNTILLGRILQGFAEIPVWALAPALLSILFAESKGEAIGRYNASIHLGLTAGSLLSVCVHSVWSGNEAFLLYAVSGLTGALIVATLVMRPDPEGSLVPGRVAGFREVFHAMSTISRPAIHGEWSSMEPFTGSS